MSAVPVKERCVLDVVETLKSISPAGGYSRAYTVEREKREPNAPAPNKVVVIEGKKLPAGREEGDGDGVLHWKLPIALQVYFLASETLDADIRSIGNAVEADLERALLGDVHRGGWADDTVIDDPEFGGEPFENDANGWGGWLYTFLVLYSTKRNDPAARAEG